MGAEQGAGWPVVSFHPGFLQKGVSGEQGQQSPYYLAGCKGQLCTYLHSCPARSTSQLALGRGQALAQNRITQVPRPPPQAPQPPSLGLTKDPFGQSSTLVP